MLDEFAGAVLGEVGTGVGRRVRERFVDPVTKREVAMDLPQAQEALADARRDLRNAKEAHESGIPQALGFAAGVGALALAAFGVYNLRQK